MQARDAGRVSRVRCARGVWGRDDIECGHESGAGKFARRAGGGEEFSEYWSGSTSHEQFWGEAVARGEPVRSGVARGEISGRRGGLTGARGRVRGSRRGGGGLFPGCGNDGGGESRAASATVEFARGGAGDPGEAEDGQRGAAVWVGEVGIVE